MQTQLSYPQALTAKFSPLVQSRRIFCSKSDFADICKLVGYYPLMPILSTI